MALLSWLAKMEFSEVLMKLSNAFLNDTGEGNDFKSSLTLFNFWEHCGENLLFKLTFLGGSLFHNILCCGSGFIDWIAVELKIWC